MADARMVAQVTQNSGFIAALDQSGGSTPGALKLYGVSEDDYSTEAEMFELMHKMRTRIMTAPSFTGSKVIGAILFERTMDSKINGQSVPAYLWEERGIVPFVKVDRGLEAEGDGVSLLKPMPDLETLLARAMKLRVAGTKMRSTIRLANPQGIAAVVRQQFEIGEQIAGRGLLPILEPEVSIKSPDKAGAEALLLEEISKALEALPAGLQVMLKLTIPEKADFYRPLTKHAAVARVVALSGGYTRQQACEKLARNHRLIGSFSRALLEELKRDMSDEAFDVALSAAVDEIYAASVEKAP